MENNEKEVPQVEAPVEEVPDKVRQKQELVQTGSFVDMILPRNTTQAAEDWSLAQAWALAGLDKDSDKFSATVRAAKAYVRIRRGREIGMPEVASIENIHVILGEGLAIGAHAMTSVIRNSGCNFQIWESDDKICKIQWFYDKEMSDPAGYSQYTITEAQQYGLTTKKNWRYKKDMLFARAVSRGAKRFYSHLFNGKVFLPDELGSDQLPNGMHAVDMEDNPIASLSKSLDKLDAPLDAQKVAVNAENLAKALDEKHSRVLGVAPAKAEDGLSNTVKDDKGNIIQVDLDHVSIVMETKDDGKTDIPPIATSDVDLKDYQEFDAEPRRLSLREQAGVGDPGEPNGPPYGYFDDEEAPVDPVPQKAASQYEIIDDPTEPEAMSEFEAEVNALPPTKQKRRTKATRKELMDHLGSYFGPPGQNHTEKIEFLRLCAGRSSINEFGDLDEKERGRAVSRLERIGPQLGGDVSRVFNFYLYCIMNDLPLTKDAEQASARSAYIKWERELPDPEID